MEDSFTRKFSIAFLFEQLRESELLCRHDSGQSLLFLV